MKQLRLKITQEQAEKMMSIKKWNISEILYCVCIALFFIISIIEGIDTKNTMFILLAMPHLSYLFDSIRTISRQKEDEGLIDILCEELDKRLQNEKQEEE